MALRHEYWAAAHQLFLNFTGSNTFVFYHQRGIKEVCECKLNSLILEVIHGQLELKWEWMELWLT